MITTDLTTLKINKLTKSQYEAALAAGTVNENELYMTSEEEAESVFPTVSPSDSGKTLVVNESGEWEVNIVQPDWNINDSTSASYVKNRPFYTGDLVETYVVQDASLVYSGGNNSVKQYNFPSSFNLVAGTTYKVYWNSVVYECVCSVLGGSSFVIGNPSIAQLGDDTGEPFLIGTDNQSICECYTTDTADSIVISISFSSSEIVKIDEKYLPVATDDSYGAVKTSNLVTAYNFPSVVSSSDMIKAIEEFNKGKAVIIWSTHPVCYAYYDSSDSSIYISYSDDPFIRYKSKIHPDPSRYIKSLEEFCSADYCVVDGISFIKGVSGGSNIYNLNFSDGVLEFQGTPIAYKRRIETYTLRSSEWDATTKTYSFEDRYPSEIRDIEVDIDGDNCTDEQLDAWITAKPLSSSTNKIVAKGDIPIVDIPVILTITPLRYEFV